MDWRGEGRCREVASVIGGDGCILSGATLESLTARLGSKTVSDQVNTQSRLPHTNTTLVLAECSFGIPGSPIVTHWAQSAIRRIKNECKAFRGGG